MVGFELKNTIYKNVKYYNKLLVFYDMIVVAM